MLNLKPIVDAILAQYSLPMFGIHGVVHWARVLENGLRLAAVTGAHIEVVQLFAVFHDSQRVTEETDPSHGIRGASFAASLRGPLFDLDDDDVDLLFVACAGHMDRPIDDDPTVQTCWDADRLDLGRIGAGIDPAWLGTGATENPRIVQWAARRAHARVVPEIIQRDWGIRADRAARSALVGSGRRAR
jgi:uncharacterized protein